MDGTPLKNNKCHVIGRRHELTRHETNRHEFFFKIISWGKVVESESPVAGSAHDGCDPWRSPDKIRCWRGDDCDTCQSRSAVCIIRLISDDYSLLSAHLYNHGVGSRIQVRIPSFVTSISMLMLNWRHIYLSNGVGFAIRVRIASILNLLCNSKSSFKITCIYLVLWFYL